MAKGARQKSSKEFSDTLGPVLALGSRLHGLGLAVGLGGALLLHGSAAAQAANSLFAMSDFARTVLVRVETQLRTRYDIDVDQPKKVEEPEDEPEPEEEPPEPEARPTPRAASEPAPPPPPAEATKVLTAEEDPDAPLDLTDQGFISGTGERFAGGITTAAGTSKKAVRNRAASKEGMEGGAGTKPKAQVSAPKEPEKDLSESPRPRVTGRWDCPFPPEANAAQQNYARAVVTVLVGTDGRAKSVTVVSDPGFGFGRAAKHCALAKTYSVGKDTFVNPVAKTTPPVGINFRR
jgi:protein TonB